MIPRSTNLRGIFFNTTTMIIRLIKLELLSKMAELGEDEIPKLIIGEKDAAWIKNKWNLLTPKKYKDKLKKIKDSPQKYYLMFKEVEKKLVPILYFSTILFLMALGGILILLGKLLMKK